MEIHDPPGGRRRSVLADQVNRCPHCRAPLALEPEVLLIPEHRALTALWYCVHGCELSEDEQLAASLLFAVNHAKHLKIRELQASIVYERVAWCHAALEVILWWHDQYEDGDGPPPAIRELERLLARYDGGIPDSDPQRQAEWIDALLDERYRMGADR